MKSVHGAFGKKKVLYILVQNGSPLLCPVSEGSVLEHGISIAARKERRGEEREGEEDIVMVFE